jgi:hypothetical protein
LTPTQIEQAQHGGTYKDPVTGKPRQFDYRCRISKKRAEEQWSKYILMALECKNVDADSPVIICGRQRTSDESFHHIIEISEKPSIKRVSGARSIYVPNEFVGKSIVRIKTNSSGKLSASREGESEIYDKWSQALTSSHDIASGSMHGRVYIKLPPYCWAFVMPVVVLPDGALWKANYNQDGRLARDPTPVNQCTFYVEHKLLVGMDLVQTHIHFVTLKGLSDLLQEFLTSEAQWNKIITNISEPVL